MSLHERLEKATNDYKKLEQDLNSAVENRQRLDAQLTENEQVQKEFATLKPANTVYKLIGPVLVPQDQAEAKSNVEKRLEFIKSEIKRVEKLLKDLGEKSEKAKAEIVHIQALSQTQQPAEE
ncbi:hypothetical protein FRB94_008900 [Tulasnella sp. JGI-2019a]|nr:hypothetical protein FRB93_003007 [Tulasnella sp. JGI-2019a]KAG8995644.1 hypothetical protein FRB94_008900 [Tulasnella sp. JGI-2019a]KAG9026626.1 hypothetical protein FRB95_008653 [Tulasnella sp. JGI-2019a]